MDNNKKLKELVKEGNNKFDFIKYENMTDIDICTICKCKIDTNRTVNLCDNCYEKEYGKK